MISINASDTKRWGEVSKKAQKEIVEVQSHGKPDAYILSPELFEEYRRLKYQALKEKLERSKQQIDNGGFSTATPEDIIKQSKERYGL